MELVHDEVANGVLLARCPHLLVRGADEEVVEHLVIGEENVRRILLHPRAVRDDVVRPHRAVLRGLRLTLADVEACLHALERRDGRAELRDAARLIGGERVHRIDEDRFHPRRARVPPAVVEDRHEERLGLARTGTRRDERALRRARAQPSPRPLLVEVSWESERNLGEELGVPTLPERQLHRDVGAFEDSALSLDEPLDDVFHPRRRGPEAHPQEVGDSLLKHRTERRRNH